MLRRILLIAVITSFFANAAFAKGGHHGGGASTDLTPGKFDYYVFALSWQPAFCESHKDKKECASQSVKRYDAKNLALHGLWPSRKGDRMHKYAFCSVNDNIKSLDQPETWCNMPALDLADETAKNLSIYMPGYASCLQNHEWYKHGTCSGLKQNDYFTEAYTLDAKIADSSFGKFISNNVGKTVKSDNMLDEFEKDFGAGSRKFVNLFCDKVHGEVMLSEVRIYLKKQLPKNEVMEGSFALPDRSERGDCPDSFLVDKAGFSRN
jgi:ribonuclease T2